MRSLFLAFLTVVGISVCAADAQAQRRSLFPRRDRIRSEAQLNRAQAANQRSQARVNNAAAAQLRGQRQVFVPARSVRFVPVRSARFVPARGFVPVRRGFVPVRGAGLNIRAPGVRLNIR